MANLTLDGWTPEVQLRLIASATRRMVAIQAPVCMKTSCRAGEHGIRM
jgi:hypothetical protein